MKDSDLSKIFAFQRRKLHWKNGKAPKKCSWSHLIRLKLVFGGSHNRRRYAYSTTWVQLGSEVFSHCDNGLTKSRPISRTAPKSNIVTASGVSSSNKLPGQAINCQVTRRWSSSLSRWHRVIALGHLMALYALDEMYVITVGNVLHLLQWFDKIQAHKWNSSNCPPLLYYRDFVWAWNSYRQRLSLSAVEHRIGYYENIKWSIDLKMQCC